MKAPEGWLFPGQNVQRVGVGRDFYKRWPQAKRCFDAADNFLGFDLSHICFHGPEERLNDDLTCQLAVYTHSCAVTDILKDCGMQPLFAAGYSSGFYAAAYAAGCYTFCDGLELVLKAGRCLFDCAKLVKGGMGVIFGLAPEAVESLCEHVGQVFVAIYNTPRQTIVAGREARLSRVLEQALGQGALDAYRLPTKTAYHCKYMKPAGDRLLETMDPSKFRSSRCELISYSSLSVVRTPGQLARAIAAQLSEPVRWVDVVNVLQGYGIQSAFEVGPGRVISRSVRWINRNILVEPLDTVENLEAVTSSKRRLSA